MSSVEDTYNFIAMSLAEKVGQNWSSIVFKTAILRNTCSAMVCMASTLEQGEHSFGLGMDVGFKVSDAVTSLRDDLLSTTGERIWGLTFTLQSDGKFNIEYDYNKPEDYEESDEVITGDAIKQSLADLNNSKQST